MSKPTLANTHDAYSLFIEDLIANENAFPEMRRPGLDPMWEVILREADDPREPDIVTARTKGFIVGWKKRVYPKGVVSAD